MTHTPGPWKATSGPYRWNIVTTGKPRGFNVCAINTDRIEQEANARLIAEAPELLDFARRVATHFADTDAPLGMAARDVIARATL